MINVGLCLRVAIAKKGMKPSEFSREYGWTKQRCSQFLKQESASTQVVQNLADHFGMSVTQFLELSK